MICHVCRTRKADYYTFGRVIRCVICTSCAYQAINQDALDPDELRDLRVTTRKCEDVV